MRVPSQNRYGSIDGLRGLAAISVVCFHFVGHIGNGLEQLLPQFIITCFYHGYLGVPVFFVISGFVISLSIGSRNIDRSYVGQFLLRRSVRLDLLYWATIFVGLCLLLFQSEVLGYKEEVPSPAVILLHMFYLQDLLSAEPILSVIYWTLCLEVQLYLFYLLLVWFSQRICPNNSSFFSVSTMLILGIYSICLNLNVATLSINGLFLPMWHYFLMGVLASNVVRGVKYSNLIFVAWIVIEILMQVFFNAKLYIIAGILCSSLIVFLWQFNYLNVFLTGTIFSYLGAISYPLYLIHTEIGWKVISFGKLIIDDQMTPLLSGLVFIIGVIASIFSAHLLHVVLEKPSLKLCHLLKTKPFSESLACLFKSYKTTNSIAVN